VPISYRGALLSTLLHVSLIPTSHNRPSTYQLVRSAAEHSSTCKSHSPGRVYPHEVTAPVKKSKFLVSSSLEPRVDVETTNGMELAGKNARGQTDMNIPDALSAQGHPLSNVSTALSFPDWRALTTVCSATKLLLICGLLFRVSGCRPGGPGFDFRRYQIF
jgi:hypothetical protein